MYCWRCQMDIPMLTEEEWKIIHPLLNSSVERIKQYRKQNNVSLSDALHSGIGHKATLEMYEKITGFKETNVNAIWHHRASLFGSLCKNCKKPLRTPKASFCAECGTAK